MPIAATDIKYRYSGGSSNSDPNACLGGVMSTTTEITTNTSHNAFDIVSGAESLAGDTEYRGFYCLNNHGTITAENTHLYISSNTSSSSTSLEIALAGEGLNTTIETIANENTAPSGETFSSPSTYAAGLDMGNIPAGQRFGFWLKRIVTAGAGAMTDDTCTINIDCDTAA
jgi:hypothetical protein